MYKRQDLQIANRQTSVFVALSDFPVAYLALKRIKLYCKCVFLFFYFLFCNVPVYDKNYDIDVKLVKLSQRRPVGDSTIFLETR